MADEKLSQLPSGTAIQNADLSYWDQSAASVSQPASAISTYVNTKLPVGSAVQQGIVEVDGTTITALAGTISAVQPTGANPSATAGPAAVNGVATTFLRSDAAPSVQKASASQFGIVEVDGTSITASAGVISATSTASTGANPTATAGPAAINGSATTFLRSDGAPAVQKATASQFGIVEVDGTSITAASGVISATGGLPLAGGNLTFFVAKTGSDSNPGTVGSPFLTVQHAANIAGGFNYQGQFSVTINVGAGTFNESGAAGLGLQPPELVGLPQFTLGLIQGAGIASTTVQSTGAQALSLSGFGCQWKFGDITFDCPSVACGVGNGATANFGAGTSSSFTDSTSSGFFSPFYCFNGGFIGAGSGSTLTFPVGFHFNFVLLEGFEPYAAFSNSTLVFPSSDFGTPGTDAIVTSDLSGGAAADGYLEWRSVTVTNAAHYKGSQVIAAGVPFLVVWTDNGLLSDLPGTATGNQTDNRTLVSKGGQTLPLAVQLSAAPTTSDLFEGTFGTFKDASGPRFIAMTDGGVTYTRQIGNFINAQTGTSYTLALLDQEGIVQMSNASANTLTVPTNASAAFPIGTEIQVVQQGAGATTIAAAGGVTLNGAGALAGQFKSALLYKSATNTWTQINTGGGGGGGTPGGASTNIQYNSSGSFGGDSGFTYAGSGQATLALGTITANAKALNITGTWNAVGTTFDAPLFMNITNTASATGSLLMDLQVGGVTGFGFQAYEATLFFHDTVNSQGSFNLSVQSGAANFSSGVSASGNVLWGSGWGILGDGNSSDVSIGTAGSVNIKLKPGGNIVYAGDNTSAHGFQVYNTSDGGQPPTNYERGAFDWTTTANTLTIGAQAGGTGTLRGVSIVGASLKMGSAGMFTANGAVATLLGSVGPTGASTTVTKWLTIVDNGGTTRYIPCF